MISPSREMSATIVGSIVGQFESRFLYGPRFRGFRASAASSRPINSGSVQQRAATATEVPLR